MRETGRRGAKKDPNRRTGRRRDEGQAGSEERSTQKKRGKSHTRKPSWSR